MTDQPDPTRPEPGATGTSTGTTAGTATNPAVPAPRTAPAGGEPGSPAAPTGPAVTVPAGLRDATQEAAEQAGVVLDRAGDAVDHAAAVSGRVATAVIDRLRNDAEYAADRGSTKIEDEVVEKIAGIAARAVPGVHDLGGDTARFFASVKQRVGLGGEGEGNRGVSARLDGQEARVGVTLVVEYGTKVHPVTEQVRAAVIEAVESMLDLRVVEVNIVVDDVEVPDRPST